jgi:hypothetical protein
VSKVLGFCAAVVWSVLLVGIAAPSQASVPTADGATDASANKPAKLAVVTAADLGTGWAQYRKAGGVQKFPKNDCALMAGSPIKASDKGYAGAMYSNAAKDTFAYATAVVFRSEADAKAYTALLATPAYQNCRVAKDDAAQKKRDPKTFVQLYETTTSAVSAGAGLEAYYSETEGSKNADGTDAPAAEYLRFTYRHGRVVYGLKIDTTLPASDDASVAAWSDRIDTVVRDSTNAIEARLTAAGV